MQSTIIKRSTPSVKFDEIALRCDLDLVQIGLPGAKLFLCRKVVMSVAGALDRVSSLREKPT